jgi:hypothetical protein
VARVIASPSHRAPCPTSLKTCPRGARPQGQASGALCVALAAGLLSPRAPSGPCRAGRQALEDRAPAGIRLIGVADELVEARLEYLGELSLVVARQCKEDPGALVTAWLVGHKAVSAYDVNTLFPLFVRCEPGDSLHNGPINAEKGPCARCSSTALLLAHGWWWEAMPPRCRLEQARGRAHRGVAPFASDPLAMSHPLHQTLLLLS